MKVYYHSALNDIELMPGGALRTVPCKAYLKLHKDRTEWVCGLYQQGGSAIKQLDLFGEENEN